MTHVSGKDIQMNKQQFTKYFANILVFVLVAVMLLAVPLIREKNSGSIGRESYFIERMAKSLPYYDQLSYSGRIAGYNRGTPYLMSLIPEDYWKFFAFGFAYFSAILFWLLLGKFGISNRWIALLIFALMPTFLFLASTPNRFVVPLAVLLLSLLLINLDNKLLKVFGVLFSLSLPLFDFVFATISLVIMLIFALAGRHSKRYFFASFIGISIVTLSYFLHLYFFTGSPALFNPENQFFGLNYSLRSMISDFGSYAGISLFSLILFSLGVFSVWAKKYSRIDIFLLTSFILILSFYRVEAVILLALLVSIFASMGVKHLLSAHWENYTLKWMVLLIISCGILFSALAYTKELVNSEPNYGILFAIEFLSKQSDGVVFSDYSRGNWIASSGKRNVLDQNFLFAPQALERFVDSRKLLESRDYNEALELFRKYEIKY